jgi:photosystem II stability/assembly factor-like uncharacterized protein
MKKITAFILFLLSQLAIPVSAQWEWQHPYPLGNDLKEVFCINNDEGWVVGELGSILKTTDGGLTFHRMECPVHADLNSVEYFNSTLGFCAGENGTLLMADVDGEHWTVVETGIQDDLMDICLVQPDQAWVVGKKGTILHSPDGGESWEDQWTDTTLHLNSVCFLDQLNGWAAGWNDDNEGVFLHTTNGGSEWVNLSTTGLPSASVIHMINNDNGWAVMGAGDVYKTTNGGEEWTFQFPNPALSTRITDIIFRGPDKGWAVGRNAAGAPVNPSVIMHTSDGGETWDYQSGNSWYGFNGVYFTDEDHGCAVGNIGTVTCTPSGGEPWVVLAGNFERPSVHDIFFADGMNGWAAGSSQYPNASMLMRTTDGGWNWEELPAGENKFRGLFFMDSSQGWAAGGANNTAVIKHTSDGGLTWETQLELSTWFRFRDICFVDPDRGWAVGSSINTSTPQGSIFYTTTNGGDTWTEVTGVTGQALSSICFTDNDQGWIAGHEVILSTGNGGTSWDELWTGDHSWKSICFTDFDHGWVVGDSISGQGTPTVLMSTSNGGETWEKEYFPVKFSEVVFLDNTHGWLAGDGGLVLYTADGGATWVPQFSATNHNLHTIAFTDLDNGWIAGDFATILHTESGGLVNDPGIPAPAASLGLTCHPNPFGKQAVIRFSLEADSPISLTIHDLNGRILDRVVLERFTRGDHALGWSPVHRKPGIYLLTILTPFGKQTVKVIRH